jgi:hypothetical protein
MLLMKIVHLNFLPIKYLGGDIDEGKPLSPYC